MKIFKKMFRSEHRSQMVNLGGCGDMGGITQLQYMLTHNMPEVLQSMRMGLDKESNDFLDILLQRFVILPENLPGIFQVDKEYIESLRTPEEVKMEELYNSELEYYKSEYKIDTGHYNADTFAYHSGLRFRNNKIKKYISGKDFIDGGAYIGDTALVYLKHYNPNKVHSFELSGKNCEHYKKIMRDNDIPPDRFVINHIGLSDKRGTVEIDDRGTQSTSIHGCGGESVQLTDIDSYALENSLSVGFIKADVEGAGLSCTHGMVETIKRDRPVLCLSIYHNPEEFWEIKPLLDKVTTGLNYKITIEKHIPSPRRQGEVVLFAYPKELD